jgi:hypothetical protein
MKNSKLSQEAAKTIAKAKRIEEKKKAAAAKASEEANAALGTPEPKVQLPPPSLPSHSFPAFGRDDFFALDDGPAQDRQR